MIIYLDEYIAVCQKSAGLLCEGEGKDCLPHLLKLELEARGEKNTNIFTVHRLDRETEGIVVYARTSAAAADLSARISAGEWDKIYLAWLWGVPENESGELNDLLYYDRNRSKSFVVDRERRGVKSATLRYETLRRSADGKKTLVRVKLLTGRTHQIRVQFASRSLPLCGDRRYGAPAESGSSLTLAAIELTFKHPKTHKIMNFKIDSELINQIN